MSVLKQYANGGGGGGNDIEAKWMFSNSRINFRKSLDLKQNSRKVIGRAAEPRRRIMMPQLVF